MIKCLLSFFKIRLTLNSFNTFPIFAPAEKKQLIPVLLEYSLNCITTTIKNIIANGSAHRYIETITLYTIRFVKSIELL